MRRGRSGLGVGRRSVIQKGREAEGVWTKKVLTMEFKLSKEKSNSVRGIIGGVGSEKV